MITCSLLSLSKGVNRVLLIIFLGAFSGTLVYANVSFNEDGVIPARSLKDPKAIQPSTDSDLIQLNHNWYIAPLNALLGVRSATALLSEMSQATEKTVGRHWIRTSVPNTLMGSLINAGVFDQDVLFRDQNLQRFDKAVIEKLQLRSPWVYRKVFDLPDLASDDGVLLTLEGINYRARLYINGQPVAIDSPVTHNEIINPFVTYRLDISKYIKPGKNAIALMIIPPYCEGEFCPQEPGDYTADFTVGFVDWAPVPPDLNMGVYRPVSIKVMPRKLDMSSLSADTLSLDGTSNADQANLDETTATVRPRFMLANRDDKEQTVTVRGTISFDDVEISSQVKTVTLAPGSERDLLLPPVKINNPKLWWPHTMGAPNLYRLTVTISDGSSVMAEQQQFFGVRTINTEVVKSPDSQLHYRTYSINGQPLQIIGTGWTDAIFLNDSAARIATKLQHIKHMNFNLVRLEGYWGSTAQLYRLADQLGILLLPGWSAAWNWPYYVTFQPPDAPNLPNCDDIYGCVLTDDDQGLIAKAFTSQVLMLRSHPSILGWLVDSDHQPLPDLERRYAAILKAHDDTRDYVVSAAEVTSVVSGEQKAGLKMRGPYAYEPPRYWFQDVEYGGAFGFNSEVGVGGSVPARSSLQRMFSPANLASYWQNPTWDFHVGPYTFNSLNQFFNPNLERRYGKPDSLDDYVMKAAMHAYESTNGMLEAVAAYKMINPHVGVPATGIIQWMVSPPWPKLYWQLFDFNLLPTASYYAAKKANRPIHALLNADSRQLAIVNQTLDDYNVILKVQLYDAADDRVPLKKWRFDASALANSTTDIDESILTPTIIDAITGENFYIALCLADASKPDSCFDDNFYWLSKTRDQLNYQDSLWYVTPLKPGKGNSADYQSMLTTLKNNPVELEVSCRRSSGARALDVLVSNTSEHIAFFTELSLMSSGRGETPVLPVFWTDNYISLPPGETREITVDVPHTGMHPFNPTIEWNGWNTSGSTECR